MVHMDIIKGKANFDQEPTQAEILLQNLKDSKLSTLVVEGESDKKIYTWLRDWLSKHLMEPDLVDVQPVGGKDEVLEIYNKRAEFENQVAVAFMVDRDKWVFSGIPRRYETDIICTHGYSIENDLYSDGEPETLIPAQNIARYNYNLEDAVRKWASDVALWAQHRFNHLTLIQLKKTYRRVITSDPKLKLQGKKLFDLLSSVCNCSHSELYWKVFSTIDWDKSPPRLLSRLVWEIQTKISHRKAHIHGTPIRIKKP